MEEKTIILVKKLGFKRLYCSCGVAEIPVDPTEDVTDMLREFSKKAGLKLLVMDATDSVLQEYKIKELPAVVFNGKVFPADEEGLQQASLLCNPD